MRTFDTSLVEVGFVSSRALTQEFQGRRTRGAERTYAVRDWNFDRKNEWRFVVFLPDHWLKGTYSSVQPQVVPSRPVWSGLERRSLQFAPCTKLPHRGRCYAQLALADPSGERNRIILKRGQVLPKWMDSFSVRPKTRVTTSAARDGESFVAVFDKSDVVGMIRLFFALKPWALSARFVREEAAAARGRTRARALRAKHSLRGLVVSITGELSIGTRWAVQSWLRKRGAIVRRRPSPKCQLLLVGLGPGGKLVSAKTYGVPTLREAGFLKRFGSPV